MYEEASLILCLCLTKLTKLQEQEGSSVVSVYSEIITKKVMMIQSLFFTEQKVKQEVTSKIK